MTEPQDLSRRDISLARPWLEGLNPAQLDAASTLDGPVLILAGAGTGKTRTLTARLTTILAEKRAWPSEILAVTFTNKAAHEMRERLAAMIGPGAEGMPWLGTFHAIAARMLRRHAELVGLQSNFTILDADDVVRLLKQILVAENVDEKRWPAKQLAAILDRWKNRGWTPDDVPTTESTGFADGKAPALYARYQQELKRLNAADFGDLLLHVLTIFGRHPDILTSWQKRFRYALVDEYQDTNAAQYRWLRLLTAPSCGGQGNLCCVGDDDQSIYSWRGAEISNILRFEEDFPGARIIRLEENYRSTSHILAAASHLIANNEGRLGKTLWTKHTAGTKVKVIGTWDGPEEARVLGQRISALLQQGTPPNAIAILVRASFQTREFEDHFIAAGLPYRIVGGFRFYERAEIRDAIAYLRIVAQPSDSLAFERILNTPKRGIGATSLAKLLTAARQEAKPLLDVAQSLTEGKTLRPQTRQALAAFLTLLKSWHTAIAELTPADLMERILEESGYFSMLSADKSAEAAGRHDNLAELLRALEDFPDLQSFLEHVALVMDNERQDGGRKVLLMTLHAAKGLEFEHVFLPGWEEGLFPSQRALDEGGHAALEEERRLAYVGLTRARQQATITHAANRRIYGQWSAAIPSRFIAELPEAHIEKETTFSGDTGLWEDAFYHHRPVARKVAEPQAPRKGGIETTPRTDISVGGRVFHTKFGMGTIQGKSGNKLDILFDKAGHKMVLDSFVEPA